MAGELPGPTDPILQWVVPSAVVFVMGLALAVLVLRAAPSRLANRVTAALLALEAAFVLAYCFFGDANIVPVDDELLVRVLFPIFGLLVFLPPVLYLGLLSTLPTPLVGWLRRGRWAYAFVPALAMVGILMTERLDAWWPVPVAFLFVVYGFAIVAAVSAVRHAPAGSPARAQAKAFAVAFVVRDALTLFFWGAMLIVPTGDVSSWPSWKQHMLYATNFFALVQLVYLPLLAYGVLRARLFDIDLRIKRGISAGTLTAVFVVVFFVASEVTQQFVGERAGPYAGIFAAGALLLAISPLKRFAMRASDVAMPGVNASEAYLAERKLHVYRAAVEGAYEDGNLGAKERSMLTRLGAELALDPREMVRVEDEVRGRPADASLTDAR